MTLTNFVKKEEEEERSIKEDIHIQSGVEIKKRNT